MNSKSDCYNKIKELKDLYKRTEKEYIDVSLIEGKTHYNALKRIELLNKEIERISQICNNIKE